MVEVEKEKGVNNNNQEGKITSDTYTLTHTGTHSTYIHNHVYRHVQFWFYFSDKRGGGSS